MLCSTAECNCAGTAPHCPAVHYTTCSKAYHALPVGPSRMMLMDLGMPRAAGVGRCSLFSQGGSGAPKLCILVRVRRANASAPHV